MANRFRVGTGSGVWNTSTRWSTSSGGAPGASVPGAGDTAIFDGGGSGACTLDIAPTVAAFDMRPAHTGSVNTGGNNLTVGGAFTVAGGTFLAASSTISIGGAITIASGVTFTAQSSTVAATGSASVSNPTASNAFFVVTLAAATTTTTLASNIYARRVTLGTGTLTAAASTKTLVCGYGASDEKILTNSGASFSTASGALPALELTGGTGCTYDGRNCGSIAITVSAVDLTHLTAALTCASLTLASSTGPVTYNTANQNVTVNGALSLGTGNFEATLNCGSSSITISNGTSTAVQLVNAISTIKMQTSSWTVTGVWDNSVGGNIKGGSSTLTITNGSAVDVKLGGNDIATQYYHLTFSGAGAKTLTQSAWINGTITVSCAVTISAGQGLQLAGLVTLNSGGSLTMTGNTGTGVAGYLSSGIQVEVKTGATLSLTNVNIDQFTGAAVYTTGGTSTITSCTLYGNTVGVSHSSGTTTVLNSIVWGRTGQTSISGSPTVTYSTVMGGFTGTGNLSGLPRFLDYGPAGFHLAVNSPCIDTGNPASSYSNEPAPNGSRINQGSYGNTAGAQTTQDNSLRAVVAYDEMGNTIASAYGNQTVAQTQFDALQRAIAVTNGLSETQYFHYDAVSNRTLYLDARGEATYFTYDVMNRLSSTKAADGGVVTLDYDLVGNRLLAQDPLGQVTYYDYDVLNRVTQIKDPLAKSAYYQYDAVSNLIKDVDRVLQATYFHYDALNRNTQLLYKDGGTAAYTYDAVGNVTQSADMWGTAYFDYDLVNRRTRRHNPDARVVSWAYEDDSTVGSITYPGATGSASYVYDERKRISRVTSPAGNLTYYSYTNLDQMSLRKFDNGTYTYFAYDAAQRLSSIQTSSPLVPAFLYFEFQRNTNGDITANRRETAMVHYYEYDDTRRLTREGIYDSSGVQLYAFDYQFDVAGNRTYLKVTMATSAEIYYEYNAANAITKRHTLQTAAGRTAGWAYYEYDNNGSLTAFKNESAGVTTYTWDENGLCDSITPPSGGPTYFFYDGRMTRYAMKSSSGTTYFTWDGINLLQFTNYSLIPITTTLTHGATPVAGIGSVVEERGLITKYHHTDHRGTTFKTTTAAGVQLWSGLVDAYGVELGTTGVASSIFWYQGEAWYRHASGAQVWYVSPTRLYQAEDGRFLEWDALGPLGSQTQTLRRLDDASANGLSRLRWVSRATAHGVPWLPYHYSVVVVDPTGENPVPLVKVLIVFGGIIVFVIVSDCETRRGTESSGIGAGAMDWIRETRYTPPDPRALADEADARDARAGLCPCPAFGGDIEHALANWRRHLHFSAPGGDTRPIDVPITFVSQTAGLSLSRPRVDHAASGVSAQVGPAGLNPAGDALNVTFVLNPPGGRWPVSTEPNGAFWVNGTIDVSGATCITNHCFFRFDLRLRG